MVTNGTPTIQLNHELLRTERSAGSTEIAPSSLIRYLSSDPSGQKRSRQRIQSADLLEDEETLDHDPGMVLGWYFVSFAMITQALQEPGFESR